MLSKMKHFIFTIDISNKLRSRCQLAYDRQTDVQAECRGQNSGKYFLVFGNTIISVAVILTGT